MISRYDRAKKLKCKHFNKYPQKVFTRQIINITQLRQPKLREPKLRAKTKRAMSRLGFENLIFIVIGQSQ